MDVRNLKDLLITTETQPDHSDEYWQACDALVDMAPALAQRVIDLDKLIETLQGEVDRLRQKNRELNRRSQISELSWAFGGHHAEMFHDYMRLRQKEQMGALVAKSYLRKIKETSNQGDRNDTLYHRYQQMSIQNLDLREELAALRAENERLREVLGNILRSSVPAFGDDGIPITDDDGNLGMIYDNLYFNAAKEALK